MDSRLQANFLNLLDAQPEASLEWVAMKTSDILPHFNNSIRELANALGITREAVYQWGETVPQLRAYQIRELISAREQQQKEAA